jgi:hypothetical protein
MTASTHASIIVQNGFIFIAYVVPVKQVNAARLQNNITPPHCHHHHHHPTHNNMYGFCTL